MSGLVTFFKDSFPEVHNIDYSRSLDDVRDHEIGNDNLEDYYYFEEEGGGQLEYTPQDWNIKEWRDFNKESLKVYFSKRIAVVAAKRKSSGQDDDDDDDDDDDEEYDDDDEEYEDTYSACANSEEDVDDNSEGKGKDLDAMETQEEKHQDNHNHNHNWETQQPQPVKPAAAAAAASKKQPRRRRIPHLHQAIHVVHNKLEYLDLYTQEISCHLCKVTKIWNIRETKRGIQNPGTYKSPVFPGRMPRFPFQSRQEDGPLACVFKYVMSMEIEPIINYTSAPPPPPPATVASGASSSCASSSPKRLRIFFYNAYAKALSEWLDAQTSTTNFLMRLDHIPAVSIMPFANDPRNWFDQEELIEYCLCIGDRSSLKIQNNSTTTPLRLDSETLQVRVAVATHSNVEAPGRQRRNRSEMILSRHVLQEEEDDDEEMFDYNYYGVSSLQQAWNEYRQQQLEEERIQKQHQFQQQRWLRQPPQGKKTFPPAPAKEYAEITRTSQGKTTEHQEISSTVAEASELGERPVQQQRQQQQPMQVDTTSAQQPMETEQNMTTTATTLTNNGQRQPIEMDPALATLANFANLREPSSSPAGCLLFEGQAQRRQEPSSPTSQGKEYIYTPLSNLRDIIEVWEVTREENDRKVNVYAAVLGFTTPTLTKRGDWMLSISLFDESSSSDSNNGQSRIVPTNLIIFVKKKENLPKLIRMGDVLRIHRASLQTWNGDIQLAGKMGSSFLVIREDDEGHWAIAPTATHSYVFTNNDNNRSKKLWMWAQDWIAKHPTIHDGHRLTLGGMAQMELSGDKDRDRDLTVMVTAIFPQPPEEQTSSKPWGFLRVWDGTGESLSDPDRSQTLLAQSSRREKGDPPAEALVRIASIIQRLQVSSPNCRNMETPKALCGKVVNVVVWEPAIWKFISENIKVGCFLRLRNVSVDSGLNTGFRALALRDKSWICPMPDQTYEIRELLEEHNNRMSRNEYNPESGLLPFIPPLTAGIQQKQSLPGLGDGLLEFLNDRTTEIFVGVVEFRTFLPDFNGSYKPFCKPTNDGTGFMYRFAMVLADESTYVKVIVNNSVGEKIFRMTASVAVNTQSKRDDVEIVDKDTLWVARLRSVQVQKDRFFVLTGISEA